MSQSQPNNNQPESVPQAPALNKPQILTVVKKDSNQTNADVKKEQITPPTVQPPTSKTSKPSIEKPLPKSANLNSRYPLPESREFGGGKPMPRFEKPQKRQPLPPPYTFPETATNSNGDIFALGEEINISTCNYGEYKVVISFFYQAADGSIWAKYSPTPKEDKHPWHSGFCNVNQLQKA
jgi:hypothetical protein